MTAVACRGGVFRFRLPTGDGRRSANPAGSSRSARFGSLLELRGPDGISGWGEASPITGYAEESPSRSASTLLRLLALPDAAPRLIRIATDFADGRSEDLAANFGIGRGGSAVAGPMADSLGSLLASSPAARAAVVSALFDYAGHLSGLPMHELLLRSSVTPGLPGPSPAGYQINSLVQLTSRQEALDAVARGRDRGVQVFKAKVGAGDQLEREIDVLLTLRREFGASLSLRLDANGCWGPEEVRRNLDRLVPIAPEYVEEPVSGEALRMLRDSPVPIAADESLRQSRLASSLLEGEAVSVFVLKPTLLGGVDACLDLGRRALLQGKRCVVTHSFEGPVGHAAACELALALAAFAADPDGSGSLAQGLDRSGVLDDWIDIRIPQLKGSRLVPVDILGHGIDPKSLLERAAGIGEI